MPLSYREARAGSMTTGPEPGRCAPTGGARAVTARTASTSAALAGGSAGASHSIGWLGSGVGSRSTRPSRSAASSSCSRWARSRPARLSASGATWRARPSSSRATPLVVALITHGAAVLGVGRTHDQAVGLHGVHQARHRRWAHVFGRGQLAQRARTAQDQQGQGREPGPGQAHRRRPPWRGGAAARPTGWPAARPVPWCPRSGVRHRPPAR